MNKIKIKLIIGLGNPGNDYENTPHNIGFLFVETLAKHCDSASFEYKKKLDSEISEVRLQKSPEVRLWLAKPQTFMNTSGAAVLSLSNYFKIKPEHILIVHDDIDIVWGEFKFSLGRSSAGHKGVESIITLLKTKNFWRLRIGIQPRSSKKHVRADKMILKKFTSKEIEEIHKTVKKAISELEMALL